MPVISKIRFTNVIYEGGAKRYNDSTFYFDGHNGAIVLENGGGKTVFIQTAIQAVIPHSEVAGRKMKDTLSLENGPAHVAIEWLLAEKPRRRYAVTCVSLYMSATGLESLRYVYEYAEDDEHRIAKLPFTKDMGQGKLRVTEKGEMQEYYQSMQQRNPIVAKTFDTISDFQSYIEEHLHIIKSEWEAIVKINSSEGGIEAFFDDCKISSQLVDRLLIPTIEESMEGFKEGVFSNLFQVQREGFKQYKELKEKIEENKRILAELSQYVTGYEKLHQEQLQYELLRQEAKAYHHVTVNLEQKQEEERVRLQGQLEEWNHRYKLWSIREASLEIAEEKLEAGVLETELQELDIQRELLEEQVSYAKRYYHSLQYAEQREKLHEATEKITYIQQEIENLVKSRNEDELQLDWELNCRKLKFWFDREELRLSGLIAKQEVELQGIRERKQSINEERETASKERENKLLQIRDNETKQEMIQSQQRDIEPKILSQLSTQTVEQQMPIWVFEQQTLEQQILDHMKLQQELGRKKEALREEEKETSSEQLEVKEKLTELQAWKERYDQSHQQVKLALAQLQPSWERLVSVHDKMDSIQMKLAEGFERRLQQKKELLYKERLAFRYVDDYADQEELFADPFVIRLAQQWSNQFSLLETGVSYASATIEMLADKLLWAVTLITTSQEKPVLQRKLTESSDQLQYPIRVLSTQEAMELIRGHAVSSGNIELGSTWVEPTHWRFMFDSDRFQEWKGEITLEAQAAEHKRQEKEREIEHWQDANKLTTEFFSDYELANVHEREQIRAALIEQFSRLEQRRVEIGHELRQIDLREKEVMQSYQLLAQRQQRVGYQLEQGHDYIQLSKKLRSLLEDLLPMQEAFIKAERVIQGCDERLEVINRELNQLEVQQGDIHRDWTYLQKDSLYVFVREYEASPAEESFIQLREERNGLELQRHNIMKERSELERELKHERDRQREASRQLERFANEHGDLDTELKLPADMESRLKSALGELRLVEQRCTQVKEYCNLKSHELSQQEGIIRTKIEQFTHYYPNEHQAIFLEPFSRVRQQQVDERSQQNEVRKELERLIKAAEQRVNVTHSVIDIWNRNLKVHRLDDPFLEMADIGADTRQDILYHLEQSCQRIITQLEKRQNNVSNEQDKVNKSRQRFREFCQRHIMDVKLREMAERGVESKGSYAELQEFESMMEASILKANQIAELRMQTEDQKLEQFITHVQAHLRLIVQELRELPKKTRVRTDSGNKEIYVFQIPDWEEQEGKERIRAHIEWIVAQLEHMKYQDVNGIEQTTLIRKDLDKWLDTKQLLQKVFQQGATIRISCRKVNNDQQVTGATYSWEESNRWSGGEKWSKNMTLFLGILNYIAEKRQHINSQMNRHRAVILDNPFGKASSDHVLSPVFYIAEQLGFQIIALTAHVEGKFLQDYFPVVYSCRLRTAAGGGGKQIVDTQQQIHQAYFRDHTPESMDRIGGEKKQLKLF